MTTLLQELQRRRTFAIISHPDAGKTTLTEKLLLFGGAIQLAGTVKGRKAARHATSDWMALEQQRGISVTSSVMQFPYCDRIINLLDTPGHEDFSEDTYRTLTAVDSALMVIDCARGVEERTIKLMEVCRLRDTPIFTFINKLDRDGREPIELLDEVEEILKIRCAPITWPIGMGRELKGVYHFEQDFIHLYDPSRDGRINTGRLLQGLHSPAVDQALGSNRAQALREEVELVRGASHAFDFAEYRAGRLTPVFFGSALTNFGVQEMLDGFIEHAPPPRPCTAASREVEPEEENFTGFVFKIQANMDLKHRDSMAFIRVCSGMFERDLVVKHPRSKKDVRLSRSHNMFGGERQTVDAAFPGDIVGVVNPGVFAIGDTVSVRGGFAYPPLPKFPPEVVCRLRPKDAMKGKAFEKGMKQFRDEGAVLILEPLNETVQGPLVAAVGPLQFEVLEFRLKTEYGVDTVRESMPYRHGVWLLGDVTGFDRPSGALLATDRDGQKIMLYTSNWEKDHAAEKNPLVQFAEFLSV